jgi:hypothetical protein
MGAPLDTFSYIVSGFLIFFTFLIIFWTFSGFRDIKGIDMDRLRIDSQKGLNEIVKVRNEQIKQLQENCTTAKVFPTKLSNPKDILIEQYRQGRNLDTFLKKPTMEGLKLSRYYYSTDVPILT